MITVRFHLIACDARTVRGTLVYATPLDRGQVLQYDMLQRKT